MLLRKLIYSKYLFSSSLKPSINNIPSLSEFMKNQISETIEDQLVPPILFIGKSVFIETYGCQMNENDTEIVYSIMKSNGYNISKSSEDADILFLNTCAIRENAELKIWRRLKELKSFGKGKTIGVLGCMAERLKEKLLEQDKTVHIIAGPDSYRDLPKLIDSLEYNEHAINTQLSYDETYADIIPVRISKSGILSSVSIMRGCNNMCSFCIVPFTRGRERSRPLESVILEIKDLELNGIKEVLLLGQNVNSYHFSETEDIPEEGNHNNSEGFEELYKARNKLGFRFYHLLQRVAEEFPNLRIRFTSPHPKDFPDKVLEIIKKYPNICKSLHMPAQSGNSEILHKMRRYYTREAYIELVNKSRSLIPGISISTDLIAGFCDETDSQFEDTISLIEEIKYEQAFMFKYSMREKTHAHRNFIDSVPEEIKQSRLEKMINTYSDMANKSILVEKGRIHLVLIDGFSKRNQLCGRTDTNKTVVIEDDEVLKTIPTQIYYSLKTRNLPKFKEFMGKEFNQMNCKQKINLGDFVIVEIVEVRKRTLVGKPISISSINEFAEISKNSPFIEIN